MTVCILSFWMFEIEHSGISGYFRIGISRVFTSVVLVLVGRLLNLLSFVSTVLPLFLAMLQWLLIPVKHMFSPRIFPLLKVSVSFLFTLIFFVLYCAIGIILNFSLHVCIFHVLSYLLILSISLFTFLIIISFDLLGEVITCDVVCEKCVNASRSWWW